MQIVPFSNAFYRGLTDLISPAWLKLFNAHEFNQVCGSHVMISRFFLLYKAIVLQNFLCSYSLEETMISMWMTYGGIQNTLVVTVIAVEQSKSSGR